jgi:hypothetical protein
MNNAGKILLFLLLAFSGVNGFPCSSANSQVAVFLAVGGALLL